MTTIEAKVPDDIARLAFEAAQKQNVTVDQIVALALSAQIAAWNAPDDIETRARKGRREDLGKVLSQVPNVPPLPGDEK